LTVAVTPMRSLILASASPRRVRLLSAGGFNQRQVPAEVDEHWPEGASPEEGSVDLALRKARAVSAMHPDTPVLGADTVVVLGETILGKPASAIAAKEMLLELSGKTHRVVTGVALVRGDQCWTGCDVARVTFHALQPAQVEDYLSRASFHDKAGAYGIQEEGQELIQGYEGELDTIVGLPMKLVGDLWRQMESRYV
jgi:septum formation protein